MRNPEGLTAVAGCLWGGLVYSLPWMVSLLSTDADDHVRPQRQLEQLLSGAGAADPLHGAETG